jgi:hypothetical protein
VKRNSGIKKRRVASKMKARISPDYCLAIRE